MKATVLLEIEAMSNAKNAKPRDNSSSQGEMGK